MKKVIIELEFDNHKNNYEVNDAEVINYLQELIDNDCLTYIKEVVAYNPTNREYNINRRKYEY